ncbi:hypothetical protein [Tahibacter amnicola]|uniref:Uncharacterized protein n=1 Tax=Tahibacter amnicola TaxID=2976241 RepID=A0ABY6BGZ2_9GAMM|nr:hypothetical protein [Tahibacter amnicola]UXI69024.1 hypothetical protein N4264_05050 [Tahibacter amnicola]
MHLFPELQLSQSFKLAQRAFAALLDARQFDPSLALAARGTLAAIDRIEQARLTRWLAWQSHARNPQALGRIERVDLRLAAGVLHARARLPASGRPVLSGNPRRTA